MVGYFLGKWSVVPGRWCLVGGRCHSGRWSVVGGWSVGGGFVLRRHTFKENKVVFIIFLITNPKSS